MNKFPRMSKNTSVSRIQYAAEFPARFSSQLRRAVDALALFGSDSFLGIISPAHVSLISPVRPGPFQQAQLHLLAVLVIEFRDENNSAAPARNRRFFDVPRADLIGGVGGAEEGDTLRIFATGSANVKVIFVHSRRGMHPHRFSQFQLYANEGVQSRIEAEIDEVASPFPVGPKQTSIGLPSKALIDLLIHLHQFGNFVSVRVTSTEVKFSAVNENVVYKTEFEECSIKGVSPRRPISFTFSLHSLTGILNTCVLSDTVWFHYLLDHDHPMMECTVRPIGHITLYPDCFKRICNLSPSWLK